MAKHLLSVDATHPRALAILRQASETTPLPAFEGAQLPSPTTPPQHPSPPPRSLALQTASWEGVVRTLIKSMGAPGVLSPCMQLTMPTAEEEVVVVMSHAEDVVMQGQEAEAVAAEEGSGAATAGGAHPPATPVTVDVEERRISGEGTATAAEEPAVELEAGAGGTAEVTVEVEPAAAETAAETEAVVEVQPAAAAEAMAVDGSGGAGASATVATAEEAAEAAAEGQPVASAEAAAEGNTQPPAAQAEFTVPSGVHGQQTRHFDHETHKWIWAFSHVRR